MSTAGRDMDGAGSAVIVIPAHNESASIGRLLDSIRQYGPPDAQVIVVDAGSTDDTQEIARARGATVIRKDSKVFPATARNSGIGMSDPQRPLLVFLDGDVLLTPQWRAEWRAQVASLRANPMQITGALCDVSEHPSWLERQWFAPMRAKKQSHIGAANIITTRALFSALGGFDAELETGEDVDLCLRARRLGASVILNNGFKVHHEGFPKDLGHFLRRERWHGTGDLLSLRHAIRSKVVWATAVFVLLHLLGLAAAVHAAATGRGYPAMWACIAGIVILCILGARRAVGGGARPGIGTVAIMYIYYVGRALSMWDAARRALVPRRGRDRPPKSAA